MKTTNKCSWNEHGVVATQKRARKIIKNELQIMGSRIAVIYETPSPAALCRQARPYLGQGHHHTFSPSVYHEYQMQRMKNKCPLPSFPDTTE